MSNFEQTASVHEVKFYGWRVGSEHEESMSMAAKFQAYAAEALRWARLANNERDQHALITLAHIWMQAAVRSEQPRAEEV
jgi:hypothetical protein